MLRAAQIYRLIFSYSILELNYCILLVQGRYSSVLQLKMFAPTADSDATTLLRIKKQHLLFSQCQTVKRLIKPVEVQQSSLCLLQLVTTKMCTHSEPNCASTTWISNISVYLSLYFYVHQKRDSTLYYLFDSAFIQACH